MKDLKQTYGPWSVIGKSHRNKNVIVCECKCGVLKNMFIDDLRKVDYDKCRHTK